MAQLSARQLALAALRLWRKEKRFADSIVSELLAKAGLTPSDRAFALELFYGVLRNLTLLDFWIACLRVSRVDADLRDILRLGLYQLFFLQTAEHAAVHETVKLGAKGQRPIINAMLRTAATERAARIRECAAPVCSYVAPTIPCRTLAAAFRRRTRTSIVQMEQPSCASLWPD